MRVSSERSSRAAGVRYLLKIAWRTIPRCGWWALIFLCAGLYMLFDTCGAWRQLWLQQHIPLEIMASVNGDAVALEELLQIDGIDGVSPIRRLDVQLISGDNVLTCEILAVVPDYLSFPMAQGVLFPTQSNMPCLIGNEVLLARGFSCGRTLTLRSDAGERTAMLCGIFQDGSLEPTVYMSFEAAVSTYLQAESRELILTLSGASVWKSVVSELQKYGVYPKGESITEPGRGPVFSRAWMCIALLCCAAALLRERRRLELLTSADELLTPGIRGSYPLRLLMTVLCCALGAALVYGVF